jgi:hypothetical protein
MNESFGIVHRVKWAQNVPSVVGSGLSTLNILNTLRKFFNSSTGNSVYWEIDDTIPGSDYDDITKIAPMSSGSNRYASLVIKPKPGINVDLKQRIVFWAYGSNLSTFTTNGYLWAGYAPEGVFHPTDGVNLTNFPGTSPRLRLYAEPSCWTGFRNIVGRVELTQRLGNYFYICEYRDNPALVNDVGSSLFIGLIRPTFLNAAIGGSENQIFFNTEEENIDYSFLIGRVITPFSFSVEDAIKNKGDGLLTGRLNSRTGVSENDQMEHGTSTNTDPVRYDNHSSVIRTGLTEWSYCSPLGMGLVNGGGSNFGRNPPDHYIYGKHRELIPILVSGLNGEARPLRDPFNRVGIIGVFKYIRQGSQTGCGYAGSLMESQTPGSQQAWYSVKTLSTIFNAGRHLLWNKNTTEVDYS